MSSSLLAAQSISASIVRMKSGYVTALQSTCTRQNTSGTVSFPFQPFIQFLLLGAILFQYVPTAYLSTPLIYATPFRKWLTFRSQSVTTL